MRRSPDVQTKKHEVCIHETEVRKAQGACVGIAYDILSKSIKGHFYTVQNISHLKYDS